MATPLQQLEDMAAERAKADQIRGFVAMTRAAPGGLHFAPVGADIADVDRI